jgi:type II secretory pathway component GspD/PulD (secretin)
MQKLLIIMTALVLTASTGFSQTASDRVSSILDELTVYQTPQEADASQPDSKPVPVVVTTPSVPQDVPEPVAAPVVSEAASEAAETDMDIVIPPGMTPPESDSLLSRIYPRTQLEQNQRKAETGGMEEVRAAWSTDLVFRSYSLEGAVAEKLKFDSTGAPADVSGLFPQIDFPGDASAIYQPEIPALFVRNTRENLEILETILSAMGLAGLTSDVEQIEIEAKFVEVSEGTLEELGFQWNFDGTVSTGIEGGDVVASDGAGGLFSEALRGSPNNSAGGKLPFNKNIDLGGNGRLTASGDWSAFQMIDTFNSVPAGLTLANKGSNPVDILISALDQSTGVDVLSAPRIVTRSGEEAVIRVGEVHSFPEVYEGDAGQGAILNVSYQDFEEKLLGVELIATPEVDGELINLALNPIITEIVGWRKYELAPANSIYNYRQTILGARYTHEAIVAQLPIYKVRRIESEVTVADGSTIGMGGLISETKEVFEDRVPVLGSLPLVGRLFRNEGERAVKRNLLMFVNARKVEPSGRINTSRSFE